MNQMAETLAALTGIGLLFNLILIAWRYIIRNDQLVCLAKWSLMLLDAGYILCSVTLMAFLIHLQFPYQGLCHVAGFLFLFSPNITLLMLTSSTMVLLLWQLRRITLNTSPREHIAIYLLTITPQWLIPAALAMFPHLLPHYFNLNDNNYFGCVPVRLGIEQSWAFSLLMLCVSWTTTLTCFIIIAITVYKLRDQSSIYVQRKPNQNNPQTAVDPMDMKHTTMTIGRLLLVLLVELVIWLVILSLATSTYARAWGAPPHEQTYHWAVGFCVAGVVMLHPLLMLIGGVLPLRCKQRPTEKQRMDTASSALPKSLENLQKLSHDVGVRLFDEGPAS